MVQAPVIAPAIGHSMAQVHAFIAAAQAAQPVDFDEMCPGPLTGVTEFFNVTVGGKTFRLHGFCGGDAATTAEAISDQKLATVAMEQATYYDWRRWSPGTMNWNGVTTAGGIIAYLNHAKVPIIASHRWYAADVMKALDTYAGKYPVVIQGGQMQHLQNVLTGHGMNASHTTPLSHFMVCVGRNKGGWSARAKRVLPPGFWMADGDADDVAISGSQLVFYSTAMLNAAGLDAWVVVGYRAKIPPKQVPPTPAPPGPVIPKDDLPGAPVQGENVARYPLAKWMPHQHYWKGRGGHRAQWIVVHGTAAPDLPTAEAVAHFFQTTKRDTGTHYVIGLDGTVVEMVHPEDSAWGNGDRKGKPAAWVPAAWNVNLSTISIEHVKLSTSNGTQLTAAQAAASRKLIAWLCRYYAIPGRPADVAGGIAPHSDIDPIDRKFCPGPYPWIDLYAYLHEHEQQPAGGSPSGQGATPMAMTIDQAGQAMGTYFDVIDDPKHPGQQCLALKANHTIMVRGGLLDAYLSEPARGPLVGLESMGLPTGNERACTDAHGNELPNAWMQDFERGTLVSDRDHVFDRPPSVDGAYYHAKVAARAAAPAPKPAPAPIPLPVPADPIVSAAKALATAFQAAQTANTEAAAAQAKMNTLMGELLRSLTQPATAAA